MCAVIVKHDGNEATSHVRMLKDLFQEFLHSLLVCPPGYGPFKLNGRLSEAPNGAQDRQVLSTCSLVRQSHAVFFFVAPGLPAQAAPHTAGGLVKIPNKIVLALRPYEKSREVSLFSFYLFELPQLVNRVDVHCFELHVLAQIIPTYCGFVYRMARKLSDCVCTFLESHRRVCL